MESRLVAIAAEELRKQRTFLSTDEAVALSVPVDVQDEENLALDRVRRRRLWIFTALRDRFIGDGRPFAEWQAMILEEEEAAGGQTLITELARQVLEWSVRSGDRGAMLGGFAGKAMRWVAFAFAFLAVWSWLQGADLFVVGVAAVLAALLLAGAVVSARRAAARTRHLLDELWAPQRAPAAAAPAGAAGPPAYDTDSA